MNSPLPKLPKLHSDVPPQAHFSHFYEPGEVNRLVRVERKPHILENYLRTYRRKAGLTQKELAHLMGAETHAYISRHERGVRMPDIRTIFAYARIFRVRPEKLFPALAERISADVASRAAALLEEIEREENPSARTIQKRSHLESLLPPKA